MPPKPTRAGEYIETENGNKISRRAQLHATQHIILAGKSVIQHDVIIRGDLVRQQAAPVSSSSGNRPAIDPKTGKPTTAPAPAPAAQTVSIHLGRYVFISPGCTLHPPSRISSVPLPSSASTTTTSSPATALSSTAQDLNLRRTSAQTLPLSPLSPPSQPLSPPLTQILTYHPLRLSSHVYLGPSTICSAASIGSHVYIGARCIIGNMVIIKDHVRVEDDTVLVPGTVWRSGIVVGGRPGRVVGEVGEGWATGGCGEGGGGGGIEGWTRELWASVGNGVGGRREGGR